MWAVPVSGGACERRCALGKVVEWLTAGPAVSVKGGRGSDWRRWLAGFALKLGRARGSAGGGPGKERRRGLGPGAGWNWAGLTGSGRAGKGGERVGPVLGVGLGFGFGFLSHFYFLSSILFPISNQTNTI